MTLAMINIRDLFDLPGPEFLLFYLIALSLCSLASLLLPHLLRWPAHLPMRVAESLSPFDIAYLKSGNPGAIRAALTALYNRSLLSVDGMLHLFTRTPLPVPTLSPFEKSVLREISTDPIHITALYKLKSADDLLRPQLIAQQLLLSPLQLAAARIAAALPLATLLTIGIIKIGVGLSRNKPVEFLVVFCISTVLLLITTLTRTPRITLRAARCLRLLKSKNCALEFAFRRNKADKAWSDEALAVALFGIAGLRFGSQLALALETPRTIRSSGGHGGDGSSNSSCGAASCGGGGCGGGGGGCGGCGGH